VKDVSWAIPLYRFMRQCNKSPLEKVVLDCGAGGSQPPLSLFHEFGYYTFGIDIAEKSLEEVWEYSRVNSVTLNVVPGDMRAIPFPDDCFSFVYSYNAIDFMTKPDIAVSMQEITRVLKPQGLCYVNFLSVDDAETWEPFCDTAPDRDRLKSEGFAHFEDNEADVYFSGYEIIWKAKSVADKLWSGRKLKRAEVEYIGRKLEK